MKKIAAFFSRIESDAKAYFFLAIGLLLLYWPISFLVSNFKWDMLDYCFPFRHHVSYAMHHLELPLWNAHQFCGYPIHADPQGCVFYPMLWLLSIPGPYTLVTLHVEFLITVFIAAACFYKLCRFFSVSRPVSILAGLMYAGSGIFIGNTQHLTWLISAAYLPGIFYCYFALATSFKYKHLLALCLFLYLSLTGGYPAFDIILFYLLLIFFIYFFFVHKKAGQLQKFLLVNVLTVVFTLLFSIAFLYSVYSLNTYTARGTGISLEMAMQNAFTFPSFISFILPFATCRHQEFIGTDISMANAYFGIFFLLVLPFYLFKTKKSTLEKIILVLAIFFLLVSVGEALPFRKWLFLYIPLMDYFRFPSAFRVFVILFFLLLAAIRIDKQESDKSFLFVTSTAIVLFLALVLIAIQKNYSGTSLSDFFANKVFFNQHSTVYDHIFLQSILQLVILGSFLLCFFFFKKLFRQLLYGFLLLDLYCSVHLNLPYTSLDVDSSPIVLHQKLQALPGYAHIPQNKVSHNNDFDQRIKPLWKNLNTFFREIAYDGYNPFSLKLFDTLIAHPSFNAVIDNYPVYLAEKTIAISDSTKADSLNQASKIILVDSAGLKKYSSFRKLPGDSCRIVAFTGNKIQIEASVQDSSLLAVLQYLLPGWQCTVNGSYREIETINICMMGIPLASGKSSVLLEYKPARIYLLTAISFGTFFSCVAILFFCIRKNR